MYILFRKNLFPLTHFQSHPLFYLVAFPVNDAPTLNTISNLTINEDAGQQIVNLGGIGAGGGETQFLMVSASSSNPDLIPNPTIAYTSPNTTGTLKFVPVANTSGSATVTVIVRDDGGIAFDGTNTVTNSFTVTVNALNDPPVWTVPGPLSTNENNSLPIPNLSLSDADAGTNVLQVTVWTTNGVPVFGATNGLAFLAGANGQTTNLLVEAGLADLNTALASLNYQPGTNFHGLDRLNLIADDEGSTGTGGAQSATNSVSLTIYASNPVPDPTVEAAGGHFNDVATVTLSNSLSGVTCFYSTNGGTWLEYTNSLTLATNVTLLAKSTKVGYHDSGVVTNVYTFAVPATTISPNGGRFTNAVEITLSNVLSSATISFSLDSGLSWNTYSNSFQLDGIGNGTGWIAVQTTRNGFAAHATNSDVFVFPTQPPIYSHASGTYTNGISLTLSTTTTNTAIQYSFDLFTWNPYSTALTVNNNLTVYATVSKTGYLTSGDVQYVAAAGFAAVQTLNCWRYGYTTTNLGSPDALLSGFDTNQTRWLLTADTNVFVTADTQRPGPTNDSVRTFVVPVDGEIVISGTVQNDQPGSGGDGVQVRVMKNTTALIDWLLITNGAAATNLTVTNTVVAGDQIHFQVNCNTNATGDLVHWNPTISYRSYQTYTFPDTDGDGLSDLVETPLGTSLSNIDSDGDGVSDYWEQLQGRNPLVAGSVADTNNLINLIVYTPLK